MKLFSKMLVLVVVSALSLSACNSKKTSGNDAPKVAVKVNGDPISVTELDLRGGNMHDTNNHAVSEQILKMVIDTELLRQAAIQSKLDTDENIRAMIANSTRMILATNYMKKQLSTLGKPSESDISTYYNQHPERFSGRKAFSLREVAIRPQPGLEAEIQAQLGKSGKVESLQQWLKSKQIPYGDNSFSAASDQIQDDVMLKLKDARVGGYVIAGGKDHLSVIYVLDAQPKPLALVQATPGIAKTLMDKRSKEMIDNLVKPLRDKAKIEYTPPYSEHGLTATGK